MSKLNQLSLDNNYLTGTIPDSLCYFRRLYTITLIGNPLLCYSNCLLYGFTQNIDVLSILPKCTFNNNPRKLNIFNMYSDFIITCFLFI